MPPPLSAETAPQPRVLLAALLPGMGGMHLPRHLTRNGVATAFVGPHKCLAFRSGHLSANFPWQADGGFVPLEPFAECVAQFRPDRVVPLDEPTALVLQRIGIGHRADNATGFPAELVALVRRSLGDPAGYPLDAVRRQAWATARAAGIPVPDQADVEGLESVLAFSRGYPLVLKQETSMGGTGSVIVHDEAALREFFARSYQADGPRWVVQSHIPGTLGMHAVLADRGRVLAQVSAIQLTRRSERPTAPSSVVLVCRHEAMAAAGAAFVAATGASGFHAWDFQLTGDGHSRVYLIEHNPRPISISHLGGLVGDDLCAALAVHCGGAAGPEHTAAAVASPPCRVALFPDEWQRDPRSPMLHEAFHDAPWDDPALLAALVNQDVRFV